ncbi:trehalose utilization protein [Roseimicrobium gellanilyticum]|uniref:Trehalose utilization protein n=2 Tax=Roseimicrobium gellanilyticum TaxID=748857 RepID=A0A366HUM1_9BACT|nr:trehalose utilization protein [Roseimicrobium gellanilyticum]
MGFITLSPAHLCAELTDEQKKVPLEVDTKDASLAKVVLLAGTPSNKPGQHEYFAGCALMLDWLKQQPGVWPVMVAEGWPKDESILKGAKSVVCYMDGGDKFALLEPARWQRISQLMDEGAGLIMLHQAVEVPEAQAAQFKSWMGGVWQKDIGNRGHWDMSFDSIPQHDTTRGVKPFAAPKDGWLFNLHFADRGVTPLLTGQVPDKSRTTEDAKSHAGRAEVIAWAYERANGGRSVGFTGCDLHSAWGIESQRRFMVNSILWASKLPVPDAGTTVPACSDDDLKKNWDRKALILRGKPAQPAATSPTASTTGNSQ